MRCPTLAAALLLLDAGAQSPTWLQEPQPTRPAGVAFDPVRQVTVFARSAGGPRILEWDGSTTRERLPAPSAVTEVIWFGIDDSGRRLLLGRNGQSILFGDWRGTDWQWQTTQPPLTLFGEELFTWDARRERLVCWRARLDSYVMEFDGTTWTYAIVTTGPGHRMNPTFGWDPQLHRVLLFGGFNGTWRNDCWSYDGSNWTLEVANGPPAPLAPAALAYAPGLGGMVLYGDGLNDAATWLLIGNTWTQLPTAHTPGSQRSHLLAPDRHGLLLVPRQAVTIADPWRLTDDWRRVPELTAADTRSSINGSFGAGTYDRRRGQVLLFGGNVEDHKRTQTFDGLWHDPRPANQPSPRGGARLAWSAIDDRVLLFGGLENFGPLRNDTWMWTGSDWLALAPATSPPPRNAGVLVEDPSGGVMLFGGVATAPLGDHWLWNGMDWQQVNASPAPAPRWQHAAAFDEVRRRVVMIGLTAPRQHDTWEWDGITWALRQPANATSTLVAPTLGYDPRQQKIVQLATPAQTWDGANWQTLVARAPLTSPILLTDTRQQRLLAFGGGSGDPSIWWLAPRAPAIAAIGSGCATGAPPPGLSLLDLPRTPQVGFAVELTGAPAAAATVLAVGLDRLDTPLGGGCTLHVRAPFVALMAPADAQGVARTALPIPDLPALRGMQFALQGLALDPAHGPFGVGTMTPALLVTVGD